MLRGRIFEDPPPAAVSEVTLTVAVATAGFGGLSAPGESREGEDDF
jgi:hypothetical protein